eukprot:scaffold338274_cov23-Prasinocladus_malaysianus.AAC.1
MECEFKLPSFHNSELQSGLRQSSIADEAPLVMTSPWESQQTESRSMKLLSKCSVSLHYRMCSKISELTLNHERPARNSSR